MTKIINQFQLEYEEEGIRKKSNVRYCKKYREEYQINPVTVGVNQRDDRRRDKKGRGQDTVRERPREINRESAVAMSGLSRVVVRVGRAQYFISGLGDLQRLLKREFEEDEPCLIIGYRSTTNRPKEKRLYYLFRDLLGSNSGLRAQSRWGDLQER